MKTLKSILLWILALAITLAMAVYQRTTGPTYPVDGTVTLGGETVTWSLKRSHGDPEDHTVSIPVPDSTFHGTLRWKRHGTGDSMIDVPMDFEHGVLKATLPHQPPAGKLDYQVVLERGDERAVLPARDQVAVIRFKGAVPAAVLVPHILLMFLALLLSTRTVFAAFAGEKVKGLAIAALFCLGIGGLLLGPTVQKYAFDAYWTGWPFGEDLTDNKTALAVVAWAVAVWRITATRTPGRGRWWALGAALVMIGVYLVPHSLGGSEYDYESGSIETGLKTEEVKRALDSTGTELTSPAVDSVLDATTEQPVP